MAVINAAELQPTTFGEEATPEEDWRCGCEQISRGAKPGVTRRSAGWLALMAPRLAAGYGYSAVLIAMEEY